MNNPKELYEASILADLTFSLHGIILCILKFIYTFFIQLTSKTFKLSQYDLYQAARKRANRADISKASIETFLLLLRLEKFSETIFFVKENTTFRLPNLVDKIYTIYNVVKLNKRYVYSLVLLLLKGKIIRLCTSKLVIIFIRPFVSNIKKLH